MTRRLFLAAAGVAGAVGLLYGGKAGLEVFGGGTARELQGTPQPPGTLRGPQGRWELTIGRSDWLVTDPKVTMGCVPGVEWDMALGVRDDSAACAVGWIPLPPELRGEGIDFGLLVALIDEEYRKEFSSYTSKQAALSMRGARRRSLEVQMTAPRYGHVVGFLAVIAVPARLYVLGGLALSKVMPQYRSEFERIFESVFCSA